MWTPKKFSTNTRTYDFDHASYDVTEMYADEVLLINSTEYFQFEKDSVQLILCDCLTLGCSDGSIVSIRRIGDHVLFIPDFANLVEAPLEPMYQPPFFIEERGPLILSRAQYSEFASFFKEPIEFESVKHLRSHEVVKLLQIAAPYAILGNLDSKAKLDRELVSSVSEGDIDKICDEFDALLSTFEDAEFYVKFLRSEKSQPLYVFIDGAEFVDWQPINQLPNGKLVLNLSSLGAVDLMS